MADAQVDPAPPEVLPEPAGRARRASIVLAVCAVGGALLLSRIPLCPVALLSGTPCPGCGLTRASLAALRGDFAGAFALHPLAFVIAPLMALTAVLAAHAYVVRGRMQFSRRVHRYLVPPLFVAYLLAVVLWVLRYQGYFGGPVPVDQGIVGRIFGR